MEVRFGGKHFELEKDIFGVGKYCLGGESLIRAIEFLLVAWKIRSF